MKFSESQLRNFPVFSLTGSLIARNVEVMEWSAEALKLEFLWVSMSWCLLLYSLPFRLLDSLSNLSLSFFSVYVYKFHCRPVPYFLTLEVKLIFLLLFFGKMVILEYCSYLNIFCHLMVAVGITLFVWTKWSRYLLNGDMVRSIL